MNILFINLDTNLLIDREKTMGGVHDRQLEYAKFLSNSFYVTYSLKKMKLSCRRLSNNIIVYSTNSLNKYFFLYDAYNLASKICKENKISLISTQDPFITGLIGWLLKKKYDIPLNVHILADIIDNPYFLDERRLNYLLNQCAKWIIKKADTIRVTTPKEKEKLISLSIDKEKIHSVPFFIDFLSFQQSDDNGIRQLNLNGKFDKIVLSVSRLAKQKNIETLIRAIPYVIKGYPKCLFLIVGSGPEEKHLKRIASKLGVEEFIKFQGQVYYKDIPRYFQAADIFVNTSYYEGTPLTIQEAAVAKKPIISTPHTGAQDVLNDGYTGFIVDFDDYIGLSKKILYLLENNDIAKDMGNKAYSFIIEHYKKEDTLKKYYNMWRQTVTCKNITS